MGKLFQYFRLKNENPTSDPGTINKKPTFAKLRRRRNYKNDGLTEAPQHTSPPASSSSSSSTYTYTKLNRSPSATTKYNEKVCNSLFHCSTSSEYARIFHFYKKNGNHNHHKKKDNNNITIHNTTTNQSTSSPKNCYNNNNNRQHQPINKPNNRITSNRTKCNKTQTKFQPTPSGSATIASGSLATNNSSTTTSRTPQKRKSRIYGFMKDFLRRKFYNTVNSHEEGIYVELPNNIKVINNNLGYNHQKHHQDILLINSSNHQQIKSNIDIMQDVRIRIEQPTAHGSPNSVQRRPLHLFGETNSNGNDSPLRSPSSEEDNSPTEMNNCRRLVDKPPLVKRLTMGLLRSTEDSRPLVHTTTSTSLNNCGSSQTISDGYVNEGICEPSDKHITSKFGDSCRQSLTALPSLEMSRHYHDGNSEFHYKKKYLRETSSANSSPKMFSPSAPLRLDYLSLSEQLELKGAAWFQAGIPREISLEVLSRQNPGAFLVRQSSTKPGCFALSLRVPPPAPKVAHYLILRIPRGYKIKGFTKEFSSLRALITHHSVMPELLPVPLSLPRPAHNLTSRRDLADFDSYDTLNDFRKQMSDLNV